MRRMEYEERVTIRIPRTIMEQIDGDAIRTNAKKSEVVRKILSNHYGVTE
mgnify:CR=1 FL=1